MQKLFILYDGRAKGGDTFRAAVIVTAGSEREARHDGETTWSGYDAVWFEYDCKGKNLINETIRADLPPWGPA